MEPQAKFDNQKIISLMRITKKSDPLFKPLKKLKHALESVGFDKVSINPTNKLFVFHFGLGNNLDKEIILKTNPVKDKEKAKQWNQILPGKSYCVIQFDSLQDSIQYFERQYKPIIQELPVRFRQIQYQNLSRTMICMFCNQQYKIQGQTTEIPDSPRNYNDAIPGIYIIDEFISKQQQMDLLAAIDQGVWSRLNNRRVQHYGYQFKYGRNQVDKDELYDHKMPDFIHPILQKLAQLQIIPKENVQYDQMTINDYFSGDGIPAHFDTHSPFEEYFVAISLLSGIVMEWRKYDGHEEQVYLKQRSLVIFSGEGRYAWTHAITCRKMDKIEGELQHRSRRISITLRKIRKQVCICPYYFYCDSQGYDQKTMKKNNPLLKKYLNEKNQIKLSEEPQQIYRKYVTEAYNGFGYNFHNKIIPIVEESLRECLNTRLVNSFLDVGCGNGEYYEIVKACPQLNYFGIQICECMEPCPNKVHMDGLKLFFRQNLFDVVICIAVLHHLTTDKDRIKMLSQIRRVLCGGGVAYISCFLYGQKQQQIYDKQDIILEYCVPNHKIKNQQPVVNKIKKQECRKQLRGQIFDRYYHLFREQDLIRLAEKAGFRVLDIKKDDDNILLVLQKQQAN